MNILLIAPSFHPDDDIGAARWNRLAKYFMRSQDIIFVITSNFYSNSNNSVLSERVIRVDFQSSLLDTLMKTISVKKQNIKLEQTRRSYSKERISILSLIYSMAINFLGKLARFPSVYWWSAGTLVRSAKLIIKSEKVDVIIATHPYAVSIRAARRLSYQTKIPWIADMRDGWSSYYFGEYPLGSFYNKILKSIEKYI